MKTLYDASVPPPIEPKVDGVGFYIGGNTPHVWNIEELQRIKVRYRLPIFTRSISGDPIADVHIARTWLNYIKAPSGIAVAWDAETRVDPIYFNEVKALMHDYYIIVYGSLSTVTKNPAPWWIADWDGIAAIDSDDPAGTVAVQWGGGPGYDLNIFSDVVPLWDTQAIMNPIPLLKEESVIAFTDQFGNPCIAGNDVGNGDLLVFTYVNSKWSVVDVTYQIKIEAPTDPRTYKVV